MNENLFKYQIVVPESWIDHNGHMNDANYNRAFSDAEVPWFEHLA